jgi:hypothetical protein
MKNKIFNSIKSGVGSYILLIMINYIIYLLSGWTIMNQMIPSLNYDFFIISIFLFLILFITDFFFYKGKH